MPFARPLVAVLLACSAVAADPPAHRVKGDRVIQARQILNTYCDACHGESKPHREATGHKPPDRVAAPSEQPVVCGRCHERVARQYSASKHGLLVQARAEKRAAACTTCHGTHSQRMPAAMEMQCNRCHAELPASCRKDPPPGKATKPVCAGCHSPHSLAVNK